MKKFIYLALFAIVLLTVGAKAQILHKPQPQYCTQGQFVRIGANYVNSYNDTVKGKSTGNPVYLTLCDNPNGYFVPYPLNDWGYMDVFVIGTKATAYGCYGKVTLQASVTGLDGNWFDYCYNVSPSFIDTVVIDSTKAYFSKTYHVLKIAPYWRLEIRQYGSNSNAISWNAFYYFQKAQQIGLPQNVR